MSDFDSRIEERKSVLVILDSCVGDEWQILNKNYFIPSLRDLSGCTEEGLEKGPKIFEVRACLCSYSPDFSNMISPIINSSMDFIQFVDNLIETQAYNYIADCYFPLTKTLKCAYNLFRNQNTNKHIILFTASQPIESFIEKHESLDAVCKQFNDDNIKLSVISTVTSSIYQQTFEQANQKFLSSNEDIIGVKYYAIQPNHQVLLAGINLPEQEVISTCKEESMKIEVIEEKPIINPSMSIKPEKPAIGTASQNGQQPATENRFVWSGVIEWSEKARNDQTQKIVHPLQCNMMKLKDFAWDSTRWPGKLNMQLLPSHIIDQLIQQWKQKCTFVLLNFNQNDERTNQSLSNLKTQLSSMRGCIHFPQSYEPKIILLVYNQAKNAFTGCIPLDQNSFVTHLKNFINQHKQQQNNQPMPNINQQQMRPNIIVNTQQQLSQSIIPKNPQSSQGILYSQGSQQISQGNQQIRFNQVNQQHLQNQRINQRPIVLQQRVNQLQPQMQGNDSTLASILSSDVTSTGQFDIINN